MSSLPIQGKETPLYEEVQPAEAPAAEEATTKTARPSDDFDDVGRKSGAAAIVKNKEGQVLIGKRMGSHGAGAYLHNFADP